MQQKKTKPSCQSCCSLMRFEEDSVFLLLELLMVFFWVSKRPSDFGWGDDVFFQFSLALFGYLMEIGQKPFSSNSFFFSFSSSLFLPLLSSITNYQIKEFIDSPEEELLFPPSLTSYERRLVHIFAARNNLLHESFGETGERFFSLFSPPLPDRFSFSIYHRPLFSKLHPWHNPLNLFKETNLISSFWFSCTRSRRSV